jgi:hypothetical protein
LIVAIFATEPGTAHVIKGEPSATDTAAMRTPFTVDVKTDLRQILQARQGTFRTGARDAAG